MHVDLFDTIRSVVDQFDHALDKYRTHRFDWLRPDFQNPLFHSDVRYVNLKNANYFLYIWILLAVAVSILDLGLGVAFGLDYDLLRVSET